MHLSRLQRAAQDFLFQVIGFIECQMACLASVRDCLMDEDRSEMGGMYVSDGARSRRDGHTFDLLDVLRFEIRVVKYQVSGHGTTNTKRLWQSNVYLRGTDIRQPVNRQGGLVRNGGLCAGTADLRPQRRFHVLAERRAGVSGQSVYAARYALDVAMSMKLN